MPDKKNEISADSSENPKELEGKAIEGLRKEELQLSTSIIESQLQKAGGALFEKIKTDNNYPQFLEHFKQAIHRNNGKIFLDEYILGGCWQHFLSGKQKGKTDADIVTILAEDIKPGAETSHDLNVQTEKQITQPAPESQETLPADSSLLGIFKSTPAYAQLKEAFKSPEKVDAFLGGVSRFTLEKFKENYPTLSAESVKNINDGALLVFLERFGKLNAEEQKGFLEGVSKLSQAETLQYLRTSISGQGWEKVESFFKDKRKGEPKTLTPLQDLGARISKVQEIVTANKEGVGDGSGTSAFSHPLEFKKVLENENLLQTDTKSKLEPDAIEALLGKRKELTPAEQQEQQKQMSDILQDVDIHNAADFVANIEKVTNKSLTDKQKKSVEKILSDPFTVNKAMRLKELIARMRPDGGKEFFGGVLQFFGFKGGRDAIEGAHYKHVYEALPPGTREGINNVVSAFGQYSKNTEVGVGLADYAEGLDMKITSQKVTINKVDVNTLASALMELPTTMRDPEVLKKSAGAAGIDPTDAEKDGNKEKVVKAYIDQRLGSWKNKIKTMDAFASSQDIAHHAALYAALGEAGSNHFEFNKPAITLTQTTFQQKEIQEKIVIPEKKVEEKEGKADDGEEEKETKEESGEKYDEKAEYKGTERFDQRLTESKNLRMHNSEYRKKFIDKLIKVSKDLKIHPDWLANVIDLESANTFSSSVRNGIGATGLIQFLETSAKELGTTTTALGMLDEIEQLDRVQKYFEYWKKTPESLEQLYLLTLYPAFVDKASSPEAIIFAKGSREYSQNSGFDRNKDGQIQVFEITAKLKEVSGGKTYISPEGKEKGNKTEILAKSIQEFRGVGDSTLGPIKVTFDQMQNWDGYTTEQLLNIVKKIPPKELKEKNLKSALLMGGTNDINKEIPIRKIIENIKETASFLDKNGIQPVLTTIIRKDKSESLKEKTKTLNTELRKLSEENKRPLIDFEKQDGISPISLQDGIHPTYVGSNNGGEQLSNYIKKESGIS